MLLGTQRPPSLSTHHNQFSRPLLPYLRNIPLGILLPLSNISPISTAHKVSCKIGIHTARRELVSRLNCNLYTRRQYQHLLSQTTMRRSRPPKVCLPSLHPKVRMQKRGSVMGERSKPRQMRRPASSKFQPLDHASEPEKRTLRSRSIKIKLLTRFL